MTLDDEQLPEYGPSFKKLDVEVTPETVERLHVKILPSNDARWEVPESIIPRCGALTAVASVLTSFQPAHNELWRIKDAV
jgi:hypothetical protein